MEARSVRSVGIKMTSIESIPHDTLPKVIGHRGARGLAPENTLASIRTAKGLGCSWVEVDVMLTKDKVSDLRVFVPKIGACPVASFVAVEVDVMLKKDKVDDLRAFAPK